MLQYDVFRAITRRALSINYVSPSICEFLSISSGSGTGSAVSAVVAMLPVSRLPGPAEISINGNILSWSSQTYIYSYVVYYSVSAEGPFSLLTSNVIPTQFDVSGLAAGSYFFKVTGVEPDAGETLPSPVIGPATVS